MIRLANCIEEAQGQVRVTQDDRRVSERMRAGARRGWGLERIPPLTPVRARYAWLLRPGRKSRR